MSVDSDNLIGGGAEVFKIGGAGGTDLGGTRGGVEIGRTLNVHLTEVDQHTAHIKARTTMNEMEVRTTLAEAQLSNVAYAWNIEQAQVANSSLYVTDSDDDEQEVYFEAPGVDAKTFHFDATRAFAMGDGSTSFARDADFGLAVTFKLLLDTSLTPARFGIIWYA